MDSIAAKSEPQNKDKVEWMEKLYTAFQRVLIQKMPLLPFLEKVCWAAKKRFKISKFEFKFPRARTFELFRARSRLYRSQNLQVNTRWKALAEIYTMHSFPPFSWNLIWLKRYINMKMIIKKMKSGKLINFLAIFEQHFEH